MNRAVSIRPLPCSLPHGNTGPLLYRSVLTMVTTSAVEPFVLSLLVIIVYSPCQSPPTAAALHIHMHAFAVTCRRSAAGCGAGWGPQGRLEAPGPLGACRGPRAAFCVSLHQQVTGRAAVRRGHRLDGVK